ncbi:hypothetical protein O3M35_008632 [Rhynocoris fuscipes]|uniref:Uncharacterized protein n=1 Tax=Rhynocoris fuscipes TaxID=488301 RepID=A0AAW1DAF2_9HEMI
MDTLIKKRNPKKAEDKRAAMSIKICLLICIAIQSISAISPQPLSPDINQNFIDKEQLAAFLSITKFLLKSIDDAKTIINKDLQENRNIAIKNELNNVLNYSVSLNERIHEFTPFIQNTNNRYKTEIIDNFHLLLENYNTLNEQIKYYINTIKVSKYKPKFYRFLIDKKYDEAIMNYNQIKDNRTVIENTIIDLCNKRIDIFDNLLEFITQISHITERSIIIKTMYSDCLLNNRFGKITVCKLLKLYDKLNTNENILYFDEDKFLLLQTRSLLNDHMLKLINEVNRNYYVNDNISVVMEEFPFFNIRRNEVPWYNILYWLEELSDGTDKCNHAIGALRYDSPKNPPIA